MSSYELIEWWLSFTFPCNSAPSASFFHFFMSSTISPLISLSASLHSHMWVNVSISLQQNTHFQNTLLWTSFGRPSRFRTLVSPQFPSSFLLFLYPPGTFDSQILLPVFIVWAELRVFNSAPIQMGSLVCLDF